MGDVPAVAATPDFMDFGAFAELLTAWNASPHCFDTLLYTLRHHPAIRRHMGPPDRTASVIRNNLHDVLDILAQRGATFLPATVVFLNAWAMAYRKTREVAPAKVAGPSPTVTPPPPEIPKYGRRKRTLRKVDL